ncbi:hypothetical protein DNTS_024596 [Danionella cerebrum]|uniref:Uncharacterized protein n=1 Tax=Danionella cerebrum TaxID=2873325 RepID=A0A553NHG5_9TELE|nr:hypothetical protein DNTS_024596 [Danionella translucida]TRY64894.1 hypothetical protein DNTS_024596 [Danionella translucida]
MSPPRALICPPPPVSVCALRKCVRKHKSWMLYTGKSSHVLFVGCKNVKKIPLGSSPCTCIHFIPNL